GTERPGAVYLAATLAAHNQKGLPAFGIYGRDVQDMGDPAIPDDVKAKLLRFARAGLAVPIMRGKSYLAIGSLSMGIVGYIAKEEFIQEYLGMRNEHVDTSEVLRRIQLGIYGQDEFRKALAWTRQYCREGEDFNRKEKVKSREEKDNDWEFVVKMTMIIRDLMVGNAKLKAMGYAEEAHGHQDRKSTRLNSSHVK